MANQKAIEKKQSEVSALAEKMKESKLVLLTDYRGISVEDVTGLRSNLRKVDAEYKVIKNNITRRALAEAKIEGLEDLLVGPTAVVLASEDYLEPLKAVYEYAKNNEKSISAISTVIFLILSVTIYLILYNFGDMSDIEIPIVYIASGYGVAFKYIYGIVIIFAIYSTMISAGYGFLTNCTKSKKTYKTLAMLICISAIFVSNFSFANLVNLTYPVFGLLGLIQFVYIL